MNVDDPMSFVRIANNSCSGPLVKATGLSVTYTVRGRGGGRRTVSAVDNVDLEVGRAETVGLVGESGSGKTTAGRALLGRLPLAAGTIEFDGRDVTNLSRRQWRELHSDVQLIFQNPYASLNPRRTVSQTIGEPLRLHRGARGKQLQAEVDRLLDMVRLPRAAGNRYPHAFSGGQRQRIAIARALALRPRFIVADEPVSALDVSIQAQLVELMIDLQHELGLSYLFIAHNLAVVRHAAQRVAVMYLGRIVEFADKRLLYANPLHPYTKALLSAAPIPDPQAKRPQRIVLNGDPPSPIDPPSGCRFHTRCPLVMDRCRVDVPPLVQVAPGQKVACWAVPLNIESTQPTRIEDIPNTANAVTPLEIRS